MPFLPFEFTEETVNASTTYTLHYATTMAFRNVLPQLYFETPPVEPATVRVQFSLSPLFSFLVSSNRLILCRTIWRRCWISTTRRTRRKKAERLMSLTLALSPSGSCETNPIAGADKFLSCCVCSLSGWKIAALVAFCSLEIAVASQLLATTHAKVDDAACNARPAARDHADGLR